MGKPAKRGDHYDGLFATNLRKLIGGRSVNEWAARHQLLQSNISRWSMGRSDPSVSNVVEVADRLGYAPWQLLAPELDLRQMPPMADPRALRIAALFAAIDKPELKDIAEATLEQFVPEEIRRPAEPEAAADAPEAPPSRARRRPA